MPKVYAVLGVVGLYFFFVFFNFGGQILTNFAGFIIPGYYSLEAIFSVNKADDTQWLTVRHDRDPNLCKQTLLTQCAVLGCVRIFDVEYPRNPFYDILANVSNYHSVLESLISVVYWFPFYYTFKLIFTLWLALPQTGYVPFPIP